MSDVHPPAGSDARTQPRASGAARSRPSNRPARLMVSAGAVAALTVIGAGLVRFPVVADEPVAIAPAAADARSKAQAKRPVKYVRLKPGEQAPKGARVIREAAPTPRIIVQRVPAPAQRSARVVTRTRQSG